MRGAVRRIMITHCHLSGGFNVSSAADETLALCQSFDQAVQLATEIARVRRIEVWVDDASCGGARDAGGRRVWPRNTALRTFLCDRMPAKPRGLPERGRQQTRSVGKP